MKNNINIRFGPNVFKLVVQNNKKPASETNQARILLLNHIKGRIRFFITIFEAKIVLNTFYWNEIRLDRRKIFFVSFETDTRTDCKGS